MLTTYEEYKKRELTTENRKRLHTGLLIFYDFIYTASLKDYIDLKTRDRLAKGLQKIYDETQDRCLVKELS